MIYLLTDLRTPPAEEEKRRGLHRKGLNDREISELCGVSGEAIGAWRKRRELLKNYSSKRNFLKRLELYRQGLNDVVIGERCGVKKETIRSWRVVRGLPPNGASPSTVGHSGGIAISHLSAVSGVSEPTIRSNIRLLLGELEPQKIVAINGA